LLYQVDLVSSLAPSRDGEGAQIIKGAAPELDRLNIYH